MNYLLLLAGLIGLWFGTNLTIRGAISIANKFGMSEFVVGVAILSVGSDLPELTIAINGALINLDAGQASDVVIGSALGSALGNIGFILGLVGLLGYMALPKQLVYRHGSIMMGSLVVLALVGFDGTVSRTEGALLITIYIIYFIFLLTETTSSKKTDNSGLPLLAYRSWFYLAVGLGLVIGSAEITIRAATHVADALNIEQSIIAIMVIGLGTSLPELSISLGAVLKKRSGMSAGNLIGSNIFDTLVPIGVAGVISELHFDAKMLRVDLPFLFVLSGVVIIFFATKRGLQKHEAAIVLALYCGYAVLRISNA
jgi:cation:H+ antiporter